MEFDFEDPVSGQSVRVGIVWAGGKLLLTVHDADDIGIVQKMGPEQIMIYIKGSVLDSMAAASITVEPNRPCGHLPLSVMALLESGQLSFSATAAGNAGAERAHHDLGVISMPGPAAVRA